MNEIVVIIIGALFSGMATIIGVLCLRELKAVDKKLDDQEKRISNIEGFLMRGGEKMRRGAYVRKD